MGTRQVIINASSHTMPLPDKLFHGCVTSPPYWSLRQYSGEQMIDWPEVTYAPIVGMPPIHIPGCDPKCDHEWGDLGPAHHPGQVEQTKWKKANAAGSGQTAGNGYFCRKCGGWRGPLGLEPTVEMYIGHLVLIFREVRRVLRDDGVCWLNLGDNYGGGQGGNKTSSKKQKSNRSTQIEPSRGNAPGQLMLIPHRVALALQADGWILRNDNVWSKPSPMPESISGTRWERCRVKVRIGDEKSIAERTSKAGIDRHRLPGLAGNTTEWADCPGCPKCKATGGYVLRRSSWRHTRSHEYVFQFVKEMQYFCDQEKVREPSAGQGGQAANFQRGTKEILLPGQSAIQHREDRDPTEDDGTRNPRTVWEIAPKPYRGSHYAVYPPDLITAPILSSVPTKCCPVCGAPWAPVVERNETQDNEVVKTEKATGGVPGIDDDRVRRLDGKNYQYVTSASGQHRPTCDHDADPVPGWCLDPFVGSGTTLRVCREIGVNCVGLDISAEYLDDHARARVLGIKPRHKKRKKENLPLFDGFEL